MTIPVPYFDPSKPIVTKMLGLVRDALIRLNDLIARTGGETGAALGPLPSYTVETLPSASAYPRSWIWVSNETGGATAAISDGSNWRRMQDRSVVS